MYKNDLAEPLESTEEYNLNYIRTDSTIEEALIVLNTISDRYPERPLTLLIQDPENKLTGTLTDGDIRRKLVAGSNLHDSVKSCMNTDFSFIRKNGGSYYDLEEYRLLGIRLLPMLNERDEIVKIYDLTKLKSILPVETVIMAGGRGTRLKPLTNDTPKPLLKVGHKPIMEHNMDRLMSYGVENFSVSINYLADQIESYFGSGNDKSINIRYIREDKPLGTAGSLSLIDSFKSDDILLTNSDVLTTLDYEKFYLDFKKQNADISIVSIPYQVKVPYGVFEMNDGKVSSIREKPEYTYYSNAGIYLLKKQLIRDIPHNNYLDITQFVEEQVGKGKKVISFPFWGYWLDVGKPEDFENAQKAIQILESY
ncbi:nucleotidyltransferase family protein [Rhodohalobacter sp.]|uniref:nucleotidyltransferase family protein n=1 Tax=Rhodohalobacter sp. TaxID=1974210 RepID=UPI0035615603